MGVLIPTCSIDTSLHTVCSLLTYREASDIIKKGKMCSLFINDLDAGAGRMGAGTQYTVNNQMVNATLMNIADNPSNVQLPGVYKQETIPRVPIVCTGKHASAVHSTTGRFST